MITRTIAAAALTASLVLLGACGDDAEPTAAAADPAAAAEAGTVQRLDATAAAAFLAAPPAGLVVLDVRTPEEYAESRLDGAVLVDFSAPTFADEVAGLDPSVPYFVYCRSDNRSGQAVAVMQQLGFQQIYELEGGIVGWQAAGLPTVAG